MPRAALAVLLDVLLVLVFAAVGRSSHDESLTLTGVLATAAPFLLGLALGWGILLRLPGTARRWWVDGALLTVVTVTAGMLGRVATDQGTAPVFVVVATVFLGAALGGWRGVAARARRHTRHITPKGEIRG